MAAEKIRLSKQRETYLTTLYGKALDSRREDTILGDTFADAAVRRIDFDFDRLKLPKDGAITLPIRARHLDQWTRDFLADHPVATVLHIGCGLDSRVYRIDPPATVSWYDVDQPEVIELRRRLYPERHHYEMIACSVTEPHWLERIPATSPVLVVAEGLVMYLSERDGVALFNRVTQRFSTGQLIFDAYSRLTVRVITWASKFLPTAVTLSWSIDDPRALEKQVARLELVDEIPFLTMPDLVARLSRTRAQSAFYRLVQKVGFMRKSILHLRYRF
jgi:O-methyltransferase involved in polyketide biosynthesis